MSRQIHLNLIHENEIASSGPMRTHVIVPIITLAASIGVIVWWLFLGMNYTYVKSINARNLEIHQQLQPEYKKILALKAQEKELRALTDQLKHYKNGKLHYGAFLCDIPAHVSTNIQFTKLEVLPPPPPLFAKNKECAGPTNSFERAALTISGLTCGANAVDAVEQLLNGLKDDTYTNLINYASIPVNSIRPKSSARRGGRNLLRFDIFCECRPRRFE
jgi:hypothetical protein